MKKILVILVFMLICCLNLMADLNEGLVAHYPFNGNANDESGNGNDGTVNGATLTTDRFGNENSAYNFDGVNDYVDISSPYTDFTSNQITVSWWINYDSFQVGSGIGQATMNNNNWTTTVWLFHGNSSSDYSFYISNGNIGVETSSTELEPNEWINLVGLYDSNSIKMFVNGNIITSINHNSQMVNNPNSVIHFGKDVRYSSNRWFNGIIDDVRIYNRALSEEEIQELYNPFNANFISPETAYIGEQIQSIDTSTGNPAIWEWDFENDGIYDSFVQNPTHIYNSEGIYSVKLKITKEALVDSLIKENLITVTYCPPDTVQNVQIVIDNQNANIFWDAVVENECGSAITPDGYIVKYNEIVDDDYFWFLTFTTNTTHTHEFVAQYSPQMFYQIIAVKNYNREQIEYLESLNTSRVKLKWLEVKRNLEAKK